MSWQDVVLMSDPRVTGVEVRECGEPLVDLRNRPQFLIDTRREDPAGAFALARLGLADRLCAAAEALPGTHRLVLVEGYRPIALQTRYFEDYRRELAAASPGLTADQLRSMASRFVSPPEIAPHSAGAAVDVTLVDAGGQEHDMGTAVDATPEASDGACYTDFPHLSPEARRHRALLAKVMKDAGLVNYPTEWWHWSFGDRYWAAALGEPHAIYGPR